MKKLLAAATCLVLLALALPARAQGAPQVSSTVKKMLAALPLADMRDDIQAMVGTLRKSACGGALAGCYAAASGPLQLYFFTSGGAQQTVLLVINKRMALPKLLKENVQKVLGGTQLSDPIISISTADITLDSANMPAALQKVVRDSYFNVNSLAFASGVQLAARADLGGVMKVTLRSLGVDTDQLSLRAAVVMPIPTDLAAGAGAGAGLAEAMRQGDTMKQAGAKAAAPEAYVEFQLAPGAKVTLTTPSMTLTDATFFINNALTFGYKGNARFSGTSKDILLQFQTPLDPAGAMDLLDFAFRMAMPASFTLEDQARMAAGMAMPEGGAAATTANAALSKLGGGYIGNIKAIKQPLLAAAKPLSVFQLRNPNPAAPYRFGDRSKPYPSTDAPFNVILLGPLADGGPLMHVASDVRILGQTMGALDVTVGKSGFHGMAEAAITVKLGPLGRTSVRMQANADITGAKQNVSLVGNLAGQKLSLVLSGETLAIDLSASCVNPFEIKTKVTITENMDIAQILEGQGGVNVDPSKLESCVGKDLEAALNKIAGPYQALDGYTSKQANAALKKISDDAAAAYNKAKQEARDKANVATNDAVKAFNDAGNAFKGLGKKKKHHKGPDPRFAASVFDWDYYYDRYPDLVKANVDLATHWRDHGFAEGRQGAAEFSAKYYRARYLDVQKLCGETDYQCALQHWLDEGLQSGRQGSASVSIASYLKRYPDLQDAFGKQAYADAMEHWLNDGSDAHRNAAPEDPSDGPIYGPERIGGDGGSFWTDVDKCADGYVTGFRLRDGDEIDTVSFQYGGRGWSQPQGKGGSGAYDHEVTLKGDDYIVRVDYRAGSRVDSLSFTTNKGKTYGPYGGGGGSPGTFRVTSGQKLGCMAGQSGAGVDSLTFSSTGLR